MSITDTLTHVLAEHHPAGVVNSREDWVECECSARLPVALDRDGYALDTDAERAAFDAHRAAALAAAIRADEGLVEAMARALHAERCADDDCDGGDLGGYEVDARAALDAICGGGTC